MRSYLSLGVLTLAIVFGTSSSATAEIPNEYEPDYAEAVLEYNAGKFETSLKLLTEVQKKAPKSVEILELKAITLKSMKSPKEAGVVYRDLIQLKTQAGAPKKEIAPYAFELGVLRFTEKDFKQAESYLNYSAKNGFNADVAYFYLGLIRSQNQDWTGAEDSFKKTLSGDVEELKPATHYYLSQVSFKMGYAADGFGHLIDAKKSAKKFIDREDVQPESKKMAEQVYAAAAATLAPFDRSQFFMSFSFMTGYDSNVLLLPAESTSSTSASGKSSMKSLLAMGMGYATSPLATFQYVPSVRFNLNKNFNGESYSGEFADTTASLYITKDSLAPVSYGVRIEGNMVFQTQSDTAGAKKYHLYDRAFLLSPYAKWDATKVWSLGAEVGYRSTKFTGEESLSESTKRSGSTVVTKVSAQNKTQRKYFNPTYSLKVESTSTTGTEYDSTVFGVQLLNVMRLETFDFTQVLSLDKTGYGNSTTDRSDTLATLSLQASKKIGPRWALIGSGDYSKNTSSDASSYSYNKYSVNAGVGYSF